MQNLSSGVSISIIIPVYNEESRIRSCLERVREFCKTTDWEFEVIFADDGSTDKTAEIIKEFQSLNNSIKLISSQDRKGKGASIKKVALLSTKNHICYMDVDLAADPSEFERLLRFKDEYDVIIGSRLLRGDLMSKVKRPISRAFLSRSYSLAFRTLFRARLYDPQCGFKLFKREALSEIFQYVHNNAFAFDSEVVIKTILLGYSIKEVPINWKHIDGSKIRLINQIVLMGKDLLSIWYNAYLFQLQRVDLDSRNNGKLCRGASFLRMKTFLRGTRKATYAVVQNKG